MKKVYKKIVIASVLLNALFIAAGSKLFAGNPDRRGQAGATQLLINPWARSSGWAASNSAACKGIEAMFLNVGGTAFTRKTEVVFSRTNYMVGSEININTFGLTQHVGETGALGFSIMSMDFGKIISTSEDDPDGLRGVVYSPRFSNITLSYAKGFSDNIYGGLAVKIISEATPNISARGVALDGGVQYVAGKHDQVKFGVSLQNWGPKMKPSGDALNKKSVMPGATDGTTYSINNRVEPFDLPALFNIGAGYDFYLSKDSVFNNTNRLTVTGTFTANAFGKDQLRFGVEYGWKNMLMVRVGYAHEKDLNDDELSVNSFAGPSAGFTFEPPFGKNKSTFAIDYSYRMMNAAFRGTHSIGVRVNL